MISYQWDSQERMLQLRDELKAAGHNVWMDVEKMSKETVYILITKNEKKILLLFQFSFMRFCNWAGMN